MTGKEKEAHTGEKKGFPLGEAVGKGGFSFSLSVPQAQVVCGVRADQRRTAVLGMVKNQRLSTDINRYSIQFDSALKKVMTDDGSDISDAEEFLSNAKKRAFDNAPVRCPEPKVQNVTVQFTKNPEIENGNHDHRLSRWS